MKYFLILSIMLVSYTTKSQSNVSLLVNVENELCREMLLSYNFNNNKLINVDTLFKVYGYGISYVLHPIYENRYILFISRGFYDIKLKKLVELPDLGLLQFAEGDSLIYYEYETNLYFTYNLKNGSINRIPKNGKYYMKGKLSPDRKKGLTYNRMTDEITLHKIDTSYTLGNQFKRNDHKLNIGESFPFLWLTNNSFLTQVRNGEIVKVDLKGNVETIVKIKRMGKASDDPIIYRSFNGDIIYQFTTSGLKFRTKDYKIDVKNKTFENLKQPSFFNEKYSYKIKMKRIVKKKR